ncbi:MAG TPA: glycosyltransferase [Chthoniobacterales bacterium]|nr:glycosyltransferase [Chthoniobacterales bacterium]
MKSLLLIDDAFQSRLVRDIFSQSGYQLDHYVFGARNETQNRRADLRSIVEKIRGHRYDAVVLGNPPDYWNPRKNALRNLSRLYKRWRDIPAFLGFERISLELAREGRTPLYLLDEMDSPIIDNTKFRFLPRCAAYFKRELPANILNAFLYTTAKTESPDSILHNATCRSWAKKLRPVSLGISDEEFERAAAVKVEKDIDLFFAGDFTNRPQRQIGRDALLKLEADGFRVHISDERYSEQEFHAYCGRSLLCWSPDGFGGDCHRHYEIGACGSVPLRRHSPLYPYAPMCDNVDCFYYLHESVDLYDVARKALAQPDHLRWMGTQAQARVRDFHRHSRLAEYILGDATCIELPKWDE